MNRLIPILTLCMTGPLYGQSEVGTIKVKKEKTTFEVFMREAPDTIQGHIGPCIYRVKNWHGHITLGAGYSHSGFFGIGLENENLESGLNIGAAGIIDGKGIFSTRVYAQYPLWRRWNYPVLSAGIGAIFSADASTSHEVQPYLSWKIPGERFERFQLNLGYALAYGKQQENTVAHSHLSIGLWCRL